MSDKFNWGEGIETIHLDYTLETPEERKELVDRIIENAPPKVLTNSYLQILSDYMVFAMTKEEKKGKEILTDNRMVTINKRETSYEGTIATFDNYGQGDVDRIYNIMAKDKNILLTKKNSITEEDISTVPGLKELREAIAVAEEKLQRAQGRDKYILKKQIIEMRKDQYVMKETYRKTINSSLQARKGTVADKKHLSFEQEITIGEDGNPKSTGLVSFLDLNHVFALLCNFNALEKSTEGQIDSDIPYLLEEFRELLQQTFDNLNNPLWRDVCYLKMDGMKNTDVRNTLMERHGRTHRPEYISQLWKKKIPKIITQQASVNYLIWYYTYVEKGNWKTCGRCKQTKLAHNKFFSINRGARDGFHSICKDCRNHTRQKELNKNGSKV